MASDGKRTMSERLEPYDQGYRDGWHDIHISARPRRQRRRRRNKEYALGYRQGRDDGGTHRGVLEWWPDYARGASQTLHVSRPIGAQTASNTAESIP
jgi:hypothetical protein